MGDMWAVASEAEVNDRPVTARGAWVVQGVLAVVLAGVAMLPTADGIVATLPPLRLVGFVALSGLPVVLTFAKRWSLAEILAGAVVCSLLVWSVGAAVLYPLQLGGLMRWLPCLAAAILAVISAIRALPLPRVVTGARDAAAGGVAGIAFLVCLMIAASNGPMSAGGKAVYVAHDWPALDAFYFASFAQAAVERQQYPREVPYVAGAPNYYPALMHMGVGALSRDCGRPAAEGMWWVWFACIPASAALAFSALTPRFGRMRRDRFAWILASVVCVSAIALRADLWCDAQSAAFVLGPFFLLLRITATRGRWTWNRAAAAAALGAILVASHSLTSVAAIVLISFEGIPRLLSRTRRNEGFALIGIAAALSFGFAKSNLPPIAPEKVASVDWSRATAEIAKDLRNWLIPFAVLLMPLLFARRRRDFGAITRLLLAPAALVAVGMLYSLRGMTYSAYEEQFFARFNAPRFFYFAVLMGLPAVLQMKSLLRIAGAGLLILSLAFFPPMPLNVVWKSVVTGSATGLSADWLEMFREIRRTTPPDAVFVCNRADGAMSAFTGRSEVPKWSANFFANGMMDAGEYRRAVDDHSRIISAAEPADVATLLQPDRILAAAQRVKVGWLLIDLSATGDTRPEDWAAKRFPQGTLQVKSSRGSVTLFERTKSP